MVKSTKVKLYWFYVNPFYKYDDYAFNGSINISEHRNEQLPFTWISHDFDVNFYFFVIIGIQHWWSKLWAPSM
jgi:hypothetical protein